MKIAKFRYTDIHSLSIQFTVGGCSKKNYRTSQSKRRIITNLEYYDYWRDTAAGSSSEIIIREPIIIIIWQYPIGVETKAGSIFNLANLALDIFGIWILIPSKIDLFD
ncbi:MAG: hypothetical protein AAFY50_04275 [Cyanobacteria bacterium J06648_1]